MAFQLRDRSVTSNELVRIVLCSVLEDVEHNFGEYAKMYDKNFDDMTENELEVLNQWKCKIFEKLNRVLKKEDLVKND